MAKFAFVPASALNDHRLSKTDILILLAVGRFANARTGEAFPSQQKLASLARCSRQTANRTLKRLSGFGWLEISARKTKYGGRGTNLYRICFANTGSVTSARTASVTSDVTSNIEGCQSKDNYVQSRPAPLPIDWCPIAEIGQWAVDELGIDVALFQDIVVEFKDYWISQSEVSTAVRLDWQIVFKNHLRQKVDRMASFRKRTARKRPVASKGSSRGVRKDGFRNTLDRRSAAFEEMSDGR
jgi:hypothetical protein